MSGDLSLYFHIPVCTKKCPYCHFYVIPLQQRHVTLLLEGFLLEWESYLPLIKEHKIVTLYFGGGTPSLFPLEAFTTLLRRIADTTDLSQCEITLEANPESIDPIKMKELASLGVNRVSIGIQSLDNKILSVLGRTHSAEAALNAIEITKCAGIDNITVDLMYDIPYQTLESWNNSLTMITNQPITHLSLYNLTIEPHTVFFKQQQQLTPHLPSVEKSTEMYQLAQSHLAAHGLEQYEISAFAKSGFVSRHNSGYWTARPFLGLGPSAFSYSDGKRFRNVANIHRYHRALKRCESPVDFEETLEPHAQITELLAINLRLLQGVDLAKFPVLPAETRQSIDRLMSEGLLKQDGDTLSLTEHGIMLYDTVATEII